MAIRIDAETQTLPGDRSQSEVLGIVLLLGFTILSAVSLLVVGMGALDDHRQTSVAGAAENELTVLSSNIAEVALGDSSVRTVSVGEKDGFYEVREETGWIAIEHVNESGGSEQIGNFSLGEVTYSHGDTEIGYQGGGVWKTENGQTRLVSPPEFHYRHGTLTLPVISVEGNDRVTGSAAIISQQSGDTTRVYPNASNDYENPIQGGWIKVTVQSEYYLGWKSYFEDRTDGTVSDNAANQTTSVELTTLGDQGITEIEDGESIQVRAASGQNPVNDFTLTLAGDGDSGLNNLDWSLEIDGTEVINLRGKGSGSVDLTITFPDGEEWVAEDAYHVDESGERDIVVANLTSDQIANRTSDDEGREIGALFNRLIEEEGPNADLTVEDSHGAQRVDHDNSFADIDYESDGSVITYLQITENRVEVRFN